MCIVYMKGRSQPYPGVSYCGLTINYFANPNHPEFWEPFRTFGIIGKFSEPFRDFGIFLHMVGHIPFSPYLKLYSWSLFHISA